jgi:peroxiredoxin Q/BCP
VKVYGISLDSVQSQKKFVDGQRLNFDLLSDPDGSAAIKYNALPKGSKYPSRVTFILDPEGTLRYIERSVKLTSHGEQLAELISEMQE